MAGKFSGILLCSDFDGTLAPTEENFNALRYFTENGGRFTMASGRFSSHFTETVKGIPTNAPMIVLNGNMIYEPETDRILWSVSLPEKTVYALLQFWKTECPESELVTINGVRSGIHWLRSEEREVDEVYASIYSNANTHPILKITMVEQPAISSSLRKKLKERFPSLMMTQSWPQGIELNRPEGGKGNAVSQLRAMLGDIHTVVCVGDYENDRSMIEYADIGYAVGNACDSLKSAADRITVPDRENALAKIIEELAASFSS